MADLVIKQHDTWPPVRGLAQDEDGPLPLDDADSVKLILKTGATTIEGIVDVLEPPDDDGFNWSYTWDTGETDVVGAYKGELEITWDSGANPPSVETVPNSGTVEVVIEADLG